MRSLLPLVVSMTGLVVLGGLPPLLARLAFRDSWWQRKWFRRLLLALPLVTVAALAAWLIAALINTEQLQSSASLVLHIALVIQIGLILSLPAAVLIRHIYRRRAHTPQSSPDLTRRSLLKYAGVFVPLVTSGTAIAGVARSFDTARVFCRDLAISGLPPDLDGLRILHLTDVHLYRYVTLSDLEPVLAEARTYAPDLVLITGDLIDDLEQLPSALRMIEELGAPLGAFASVGNHEYYRGIEPIRRAFERSSIPLLINESATVRVGSTVVRLAALDDPRHTFAVDMESFYRSTTEQALDGWNSDEFAVALSHRPGGFDATAAAGVRLTLAGHTHGMQFGDGRRSLFEPVVPEAYLWGEYRRGDSVLYTSAGVGHWFPFRLGCPAEAPVHILRAR